MFSTFLPKDTLPLFLAPMESVSDSAYRNICKEFGADVVISEFISSEALIRAVDASLNKLFFAETERPVGIQIFGHNESSLRQAAEIAASRNPDFIDINWGCPVKKVVRKGAGAAMLQNPDKMVALTKAVVNSVSLPVSVKTRLGWDEHNKPIVQLAEKLQDVGIHALTIHGRTRSQMYLGTADWSLIGEVKNNPRMKIPIIGNGDIDSGEKALKLHQRYGVDALMIGRAAVGNPWIFKQIKEYYQSKKITFPSYEERVTICLRHLHETAQHKSEKQAVLEMRRHYSGYFKAIPHFKTIKNRLMQAVTIAACTKILMEYDYFQ